MGKALLIELFVISAPRLPVNNPLPVGEYLDVKHRFTVMVGLSSEVDFIVCRMEVGRH
jgi:hypothetical protein